jgi:CAAX protease family protein
MENSSDPQLSNPCPHCKAPLKLNARFCGKCGTSLYGDIRRVKKPVNKEKFIQKLMPALILWMFLLGTNIVYGLYVYFSKNVSPRPLTLLLSIDGLFILIYLLVKSKSTFYLFNRIGNSPRVFFDIVIVTFLSLLGIKLYMLGLTSLGVEKVEYLPMFQNVGWPIWTAFATMALWPAIFEELAFRGFIFEKLKAVGGQREALIVQALLFSVLHISPVIFVSHFFLGLAFGWLRIKHQSIYPSMIVHFLYNGLIILEEMKGPFLF